MINLYMRFWSSAWGRHATCHYNFNKCCHCFKRFLLKNYDRIWGLSLVKLGGLVKSLIWWMCRNFRSFKPQVFGGDVQSKGGHVSCRHWRRQEGPSGEGTEEAYSSPPGQNGRHFPDDIFRCTFVNEKFYILIKISLKFVSKSPFDNNPAFGLDNGLAPIRRQAIIWTNADTIHWRIYAALGGIN